jgi:3-deoxy-D-manno-octulosonic-acid transferase
LLWRSRRERGYREHIAERFGYSAGRSSSNNHPLIWVHAVSVGETRAAQPLIDALLSRYPQAQILLTHMTPNGRATGIQVFGERVLRCYLPYDLTCAVRRFLRTWKPALGLLMETEVWPTLVAECQRAQVPLVLTNARMSERSARHAARFSVVMQPTFAGFSKVLAQSPADAQRLTALGARTISVLGNLKFDVEPSPARVEQGKRWRAAIGSRPVWVAASTREGEEALVLDAFEQLRTTQPQALLILVPRHPQRFDEVAALIEQRGYRYTRRSQWTNSPLPLEEELGGREDILLGDSMGELPAYYAASDLAFIGGSLLPLGGQNLIEACAVGVPVLVGPYTFNFTQATEDALAIGAARRVANASELAQALGELLNDVPQRAAMTQAATVFAAQHRGAAQRTVQAIEHWLSAQTVRHCKAV